MHPLEASLPALSSSHGTRNRSQRPRRRMTRAINSRANNKPPGVALALSLAAERMAYLIHEHAVHVRTPDGETYVPRTYAERQADGTWEGWLEFDPIDRRGPALRTERETSQATREALEVWASGLEAVYFEGAFERARVLTASWRRKSAAARCPSRRAPGDCRRWPRRECVGCPPDHPRCCLGLRSGQ